MTDAYFILPALIINIAIILIPALLTIVMSFTKWNGLGMPEFNGLDNFFTLFQNENYIIAIVNNLKWTAFFLTVPIILSLCIAMLLMQLKFLRDPLQTIFFIPNVISPVIICAIFSSMIFNPRSGILGFINRSELLPFVLKNPLTSVRHSIWAVAFVDNWHWWGFLTVVFLAAMRQINVELLEAAEMDGASFLQKFFRIVIPSIKSNIFFMLLMTIIWSFLAFDYVWILTQGGPGNSSEMLATLSYKYSFYHHDIGSGAATALTMSLLAGGVIYFYVKHQIAEEEQ